jgi:membrane fusion protein (multidrug efflux system)
MHRKIVFVVVGLAAVAAAIIVPRIWWRQQQEHARAPSPAAPASGAARTGNPGALQVLVHRAQPRTLAERITANGTLMANESVELRSEISGMITEIHFSESSRVNRGDLLLKTNDSELQAMLRRTLYRIELARSRLERQAQLLEQGGVTQDVYDSALNEVRVIEAEADLIRAQLEKTEIRAPFSGLIGLRFVSEGGYLTPSTRIATLHDIDRIKIDFTVSERHMNRVRPGSPIAFSVAGNSEQYRGEVYAIEPEVDLATRSVRLRAQTENPGGRLLPGAYASVDVTLEQIPDALLVPTSAIIPGLNQRSLFVLADGRASLRNVETGIRLDREIQIVSGIEPGDMVITSGLLQLREGMPVQPIGAD